jgi:hypothetical protein
MDPRLFDIVWEVYRSVGASEGIYVLSAYRATCSGAPVMCACEPTGFDSAFREKLLSAFL